MISPESLKGKVKNIAKSKRLSSQEVLQMFFFERFLERLSHSKYKFNFVIKGGLLISSMIGIDNRTTMDMDTTVKGIPLKEDVIKNIILEILGIEVGDGIQFEVTDITHIREEDEYENFRVHLIAIFGKIRNAMKIDITTGDVITPKEIEYVYPCMFREEGLKVLAYPIETILAEKYESVIKRNISTTRMRDFYDVYILLKLKSKNIDYNILRLAIEETSQKRDSLNLLLNYKEIISNIENNNEMLVRWENYRNSFNYARTIDFNEICKLLTEIFEKIEIK